MIKKFVFVISIVLCFHLSAQDYTPLLSDINEWQFSTCFLGDCTKDVYYTDGDTLVDNKSYKILDGYHYISRTFLLREDISEKQVFLLTIVNGVKREHLLYDFSMEVGDEIEMKNPFTPFPENGGMFTLSSIESLPLVDGNNYKHYTFSPSPGNTISSTNAVWIEGVGSLSIINAPGGEPNFDDVGELSCSFRDGNSFYSNFERVDVCEQVILDISDNKSKSAIVVVSTNSKLKILNTQEVVSVEVYSLDGKLVENIYNEEQLESLQIERNPLSNGVYILIFTSTNGILSSKQVIID